VIGAAHAAAIESIAASLISGDTLRAMTCEHTDVEGRVWPKGTAYRPVWSGFSNATRTSFQVVTIGGQRVAFEAKRPAAEPLDLFLERTPAF
jgi:hypothetical protein